MNPDFYILMLLKKLRNLDTGQRRLTSNISNVEKELKEFRVETKTSLQVIQSGQQGAREEIKQRFRETKRSLRILESDIAMTYKRTAQAGSRN